MAAWWALNTGRYRDAFAFADAGARAAATGSRLEALYCLDFRMVARFRLGEWNEALRDVGFAEDLLGDRRETPLGYAAMHVAVAAFVHEVRGDRRTADRYLERIHWLEQEGDAMVDTTVALWRARLLARRGAFDDVRVVLDRPEVAGDLSSRDEVLETLCEVTAERGDWEAARRIAKQARSHAAWAGLLALPAYADRLEGRAELAFGDADRAVEILARAARTFDRVEAPWERAVTLLDVARARLGADVRWRSRRATAEVAAHLREVIDVFERLRSERELLIARQLLQDIG
jgi:tetratricopeptide (TPR) repeat protein